MTIDTYVNVNPIISRKIRVRFQGGTTFGGRGERVSLLSLLCYVDYKVVLAWNKSQQRSQQKLSL